MMASTTPREGVVSHPENSLELPAKQPTKSDGVAQRQGSGDGFCGELYCCSAVPVTVTGRHSVLPPGLN
jgi:hypothetical protein